MLWLAVVMLAWQQDSSTSYKRYFWGGVGAAYGVIYGLPMASWYDWRTAQGWRWFNDGHEWKQMDKLGHVWTTYHLSTLSYAGAQMAGYSRPQALWLSAIVGWTAQATIEIIDGCFPRWGASAWDLAANTIGTGLFLLETGALQATAWGVGMRFSFWPTAYARARPDLLGQGASQILKDYNGQTYWLCVFHRSWPMGLALGHSAKGLLGGYGQVGPAQIAARERRQWLLSLEPYWPFFIRRKSWTFLFLAALKFPFPTLIYDQKKVRLAPVYF